MGIPQAVYIGLICVGFDCAIRLHGKPREPLNIWHWMIGTAIVVSILYWGGFFK